MRMLRRLTTVVLCGLALTLLASCGGRRADGDSGVPPESPSYVNIIEATRAGAITTVVSRSTGTPVTEGWSRSGHLCWSVSEDMYVAAAQTPGALLGSASAGRLVWYSPTGQVRAALDVGGAQVRPVLATDARLMWVTVGRSAVLYVRQRLRTRRLDLESAHDVISTACSQDGSRVAVTTVVGEGAYLLSWIEVDRRGEPRIVSRGLTRRSTVFLSPDGASAVLGDENGELVSFGRMHGVALPVPAVSEARLAGRRVLALTCGVKDNAQVTEVCYIVGGKLRRRFSYPVDVIVHSDATLRYVSLIDPVRGPVVINLESGRQTLLPIRCADVAVVDGNTVVAADETGAVKYQMWTAR
jgi:hypothetical protein